MRVEVRLQPTPETGVRVGELLSQGRRTFFEYDAAFLARGLPLDPLQAATPGVHELPISPRAGLLGMIGDSIPDGWGLRILHQRLAQRGVRPEALTPADLLRLVGETGPGALTYHPAALDDDGPLAVDLDELATNADGLYVGAIDEVIAAVRTAAGPSGGARPKVLVDLADDGSAYAGFPQARPGTRGYLVKFPTESEGRDMGRVELAYAALARAVGIDMPPTRPIVLHNGELVCFGVERFDRAPTGARPHTVSLAGLLCADFRSDFLDYAEYLKVVWTLTRDASAVEQAYRRLLFNVLAGNRDDHLKNFAFQMTDTGVWRLAPAFDLTFNLTSAGRHIMAIAGEDLTPTRAHARAAVRAVWTPSGRVLATIEDQVMAGVAEWPRVAKEYQVPSRRIGTIERHLDRFRQTFDD